MIDISCTINHKPVQVQVEEGETLLAMLRERLKLTGTKRGCEVGECGGCTVLLDGVPTDSCLVLAALADGKDILTIEGLADGFDLHPVQQAFVDEGAIQCGFCTPGMVLSAYALLKKNPHPTADEIRTGMSGNFCRCAAYGQIINAVQKAGNMLDPNKTK